MRSALILLSKDLPAQKLKKILDPSKSESFHYNYISNVKVRSSLQRNICGPLFFSACVKDELLYHHYTKTQARGGACISDEMPYTTMLVGGYAPNPPG
jgi:hypothetical protein